MCNNGIWVRRRYCKQIPPPITACATKPTSLSSLSSKWQAKIRKGGDFTNSAFVEVEGYDQVLGAIKERVFETKNVGGIEELGVMAHIVSLRETWKVDEKFTVAIDSTDFGHVIGEVELEVECTKNDVADGETLREMDEEIETFMKKYAWAFPVDLKVVGKLSAYFHWIKQRK